MVGADCVETEGESLNHIIYEINGIGLGMMLIDFQGSNKGSVVLGGVLEAPRLLAFCCLQIQEFEVHLGMVARPASPFSANAPFQR